MYFKLTFLANIADLYIPAYGPPLINLTSAIIHGNGKTLIGVIAWFVRFPKCRLVGGKLFAGTPKRIIGIMPVLIALQ